MAKEKKQTKIEVHVYARDENDCGSPEIQVARLSSEIQHLTSHCQTHRKDNGAIRGLVQKVQKRKKLLKYLHKTNLPLFEKLIKELNIRYRIAS